MESDVAFTARVTAAFRALETSRSDPLVRDPWAAALAGADVLAPFAALTRLVSPDRRHGARCRIQRRVVAHRGPDRSRTVSAMATRTLSVELPEDVVALLGTPEAAANSAREALVLDLLRRGSIGQGRAAELLGVSRWDLLDLMADRRIESGPDTGEEMAREIADAHAWAARQGPRAGDQ